jgi:hypothetical protein
MTSNHRKALIAPRAPSDIGRDHMKRVAPHQPMTEALCRATVPSLEELE